MFIFLQIVIAWFYGHIFEYIAHRFFLHNRFLFKKIFKNHFKRHHGISRKNNMIDESYKNVFSSKFEVTSLFIISFIHLPLLLFIPYFYAVVVWSVCAYYIFHRSSHVNSSWGEKWLPWHYSHHMGKNQNKNWGVRLPLIDKIVGTSEYN